MYKNLTLVSLLGALTIILGAFGAHTLKDKLTIDAMQSFETAIRYQMYHVIMLFVINLYEGFSSSFKKKITYLFLLGVLFFSGSIYLIQLFKIPAKLIWFLTPLGGLLFIVGWLFLGYEFYQKKAEK